MQGSPLKCSTNNEAASPDKDIKAHKKQMSPSPDKTTAGRLNLSPSPAKHSENASRAAEDRKSQSPPKSF